MNPFNVFAHRAVHGFAVSHVGQIHHHLAKMIHLAATFFAGGSAAEAAALDVSVTVASFDVTASDASAAAALDPAASLSTVAGSFDPALFLVSSN